MDDTEAAQQPFNNDIETEVKEMMGLFDAPAFARRGHDLEIVVRRLHERCHNARGPLLDMVHLRLKQWSRAVTGAEAWRGIFTVSIEPLWPLSEAPQPTWAEVPAPSRQRQIIADDLIAAVLRFNRRLVQYLEKLNLEPTNAVIDQYNRYYLLEKECVMGSARLAARHFQPVPRLTVSTLLTDHPTLPVPELASSAGAIAGRAPSARTTHE